MRKRRGLRWALRIAAVLAPPLALAYLVLFVPWFFQSALRAANAFLPVRVEVGAYRHTPGSLTLGDVRLSGPRGPFCTVRAVGAEYGFWRLLLGRVHVRALEVNGARVIIERYPDGRLNLDGLEPAAAGPDVQEPFRPETLVEWASFPLVVERLEISDAGVEYGDAALGFSVRARELRFSGNVEARPLRARLDWLGGRLTIQGAAGPGEGLELEAEGRLRVPGDGTLELAGLRLRPDSGAIEVNGSWDLTAHRLELAADLIEVPLERVLACWGIGEVPVSGLSGRVEARSAAFRDAHVAAGLQAAAYGRPVRAELEGRAGGGALYLDSLTVSDAEGTLTGEGRLEIASGEIAARARLEAAVLEQGLRAHGLSGNRLDRVSVEAEAGGTLQEPEVQATAAVGQWSLGREALLRRVAARVSWDRASGVNVKGTAGGSPALPAGFRGELAFTAGYRDGLIQGAVDAGPSLRIRGRFEPDTHQAELSFTARGLLLTGPARLWVPDLSRAVLSGTGRLQGDVRDRATWKGEARIERLEASAPAVRLVTTRAADLRLRDGGLHVGLAARLNGEPLELRGILPVAPGGRIDARGRASLSVEPFQGLFASRVPALRACRGVLDVSGQVKGTLDAPAVDAALGLRDGWVSLAAAGEGPAGGDAGEESPAAFEGRVSGSLELSGPLRTPAGALALQVAGASVYGVPVEEASLRLAGDGARWSTDRAGLKTRYGAVSLEGWWTPGTGRVQGRVRSEDWRLGKLLEQRGVPVDGRARLEGTIGGTVRSPRAELVVPVRGLTVQGQAYGDVEARVDAGPEGLETRLRSTFGTVRGRLAWGEDRRVEVEASLEAFPLGPLFDAWRGEPQGWDARVSLEGGLAGPLSDPTRWSGEVALAGLDIETASVPVRLAAPVRLSFTPGQVVVPGAELLFRESSLRLEGTLGLENRFTARGTAELAPLADLLPWVRLEQGHARLDVEVAGTILEPDLRGELRVEASHVSMQSLPFPVERLTAELAAAAGSALEVKSLRAEVGEGSLTARGTLRVSPFSAEGVEVVCTSLPVSWSEHLSGVVHGRVRFDGGEASSLLTGSVRVESARYDQDFDLLGTVLSPRRPALRADPERPAFLRNMQVDVRVRSGPDLMVRNNIARMILSMDLYLRGTAAALAPAGRIKALEGNVYFNNRDFVITRGGLVFLGAPSAYPTLQLDSRASVEGRFRNYLVLLSMDGPLDRIDLALSSVPALSRDDVLFVLFTGMTQEEYFATPTDVKGAGAGLVASGFSALVGKEVKTWTGLDTFELGGYDRVGVGVKATLGKRIGERMELRGTLAVGEDLQRGEAQVEYQLADGFYLVGTQRTDGSFGLDLRFRFVGR